MNEEILATRESMEYISAQLEENQETLSKALEVVGHLLHVVDENIKFLKELEVQTFVRKEPTDRKWDKIIATIPKQNDNTIVDKATALQAYMAFKRRGLKVSSLKLKAGSYILVNQGLLNGKEKE